MVSLTPRCTPAELATSLDDLEVHVTSLQVVRRDVSLPDYPGGPRPSSVVQLSGHGTIGHGEHVAFSDAEQRAFGASMAAWFRANRGRATLRIAEALDGELAPYAKAALEAALIDLGLRQAGRSLADLTGVPQASLRFVVSLAADPDPLPAIARLRAAGFSGELKIDVHPAWNDATIGALAADPSIVIFDFKGKGEPALARRLAAFASRALFEDPPNGFVASSGHPLVSRDASLPDAQAVSAARASAEAVNLKAPRMGGPLELLRGLERALAPQAEHPPIIAYLGGMFEVGVGREQARQLAALYCPTSPNDLALNLGDAAAAAKRQISPALVRLDQPGFG